MKTNLSIILLLCSIGVMGQTKAIYDFKQKTVYTPITFQGVSKVEVIDTVYSIENKLPIRSIKSVYTLTDSTKFTVKYVTQWNDKYWNFKSVTVDKGEPKYNWVIGTSTNFSPIPYFSVP